jgi:hypothetical protein
MSVNGGPWNYLYFGVNIASQLQLPELAQYEQSAARETPDVVVSFQSPRKTGTAPVSQFPLITAAEYRIRVPKVGDFHVRDGREICIQPLPHTEEARIRPWLLGTVWGALCYQRNLFIVHASAVQVDSEAILFCGGPGHGKSTLAAQLAARGHALISDDLCRLHLPSDGPPLVFPSAPRLRLWSDALGELGWGAKELAPDHLRDGKFHLLPPGRSSAEPLPVRGAYSLLWGEFGVRDLKGMEAFRAFLTAATWRRRLLESMGRIDLHSRRCMEFLQRVPLKQITRPRDFPASAQTLDFLVGRESNATV